MVKGCIFDLDGVIVDSAKYHFQAWKRLADELGIDFTEEENEKLKGVSRVESLRIILEWGGLKKSEEEQRMLAAKKNDWYVELISNMTPDEILPGVRPFLEGLKDKKIKIALGSASKNAAAILDRVALTSFFDAIIDGTKTTRSKPDPEVFLLGAEALGLKPFEVVVFEDAEKGIEAAREGGFWAIGVGDPETLMKAHFVIPGFKRLKFETLVNTLAGKD